MSAGELVVVLEGVRIPLEAAAVVDLRQDEVVRVRFSPAVPLDLRTKKMAGLTSKVFQCLVDLKLLGLIKSPSNKNFLSPKNFFQTLVIKVYLIMLDINITRDLLNSKKI